MRGNRSCCFLKKSNGAKSDRAKSNGSDSLLDIKRGKEVKNWKNMVKTTNLFEWTARFLRAKERIRSKSEPKSKEQKSKLPTLCYWYYYTPILDNLLHIMDAVTIIAVYCVYCVVLLKFFYEITNNKKYRIVCSDFVQFVNTLITEKSSALKIKKRYGF